jgi:hypothetical protein
MLAASEGVVAACCLEGSEVEEAGGGAREEEDEDGVCEVSVSSLSESSSSVWAGGWRVFLLLPVSILGVVPLSYLATRLPRV